MGKFSTTPKFFVEYTMLPFSKPSFLLLAVSTMSCLVHGKSSSNFCTWRVVQSFFGASARPIGTRSPNPETLDGNSVTLTFSVTKHGPDEDIKLTAVGDQPTQAGQRSESVFIHPKYDEITHEGNAVIIETEEGAIWKLVCLSDLDAKQLTFFMNFVMPNCIYRRRFRLKELAICADEANDLRVITLQTNEYQCFKVTTKICRWKKSKTPALTLCEKPCIPSVARSDPTNQLPEFLKQLKAYTSCVVGGKTFIKFRRGFPARCAFITKLENFAEPSSWCSKRRLRGVSPVMLRLLEPVEEIRAAQ